MLKKTIIIPFKSLSWKIKIQHRRDMFFMHSKTPKLNKADYLFPVLPLIALKSPIGEEDKWKCTAFGLKIRVGQPSDVTRYKKYVRKFEEGSTQEWIDMFKYLRRYRQGVHGQVIGKRRKCSCL
jgi:hypothetical protein